jgi:hypothetical protein
VDFDSEGLGKTNLEAGSGIIVESVSHPGESYYRSDSSWLDLYDFNDTANFCIKGLATEVLPGDFDGDFDVDFDDFAILALAWLTEPGDAKWNPDCDISIPPDDIINEKDLDIFCDNWLLGK